MKTKTYVFDWSELRLLFAMAAVSLPVAVIVSPAERLALSTDANTFAFRYWLPLTLVFYGLLYLPLYAVAAHLSHQVSNSTRTELALARIAQFVLEHDLEHLAERLMRLAGWFGRYDALVYVAVLVVASGLALAHLGQAQLPQPLFVDIAQSVLVHGAAGAATALMLWLTERGAEHGAQL